MKSLKIVALTLVLVSLLAACTASLPQQEVDAANAAFAAAKTAQADVLAPESFKAASDANDALQANVAGTDFSQTKQLAQALSDASAKAAADAAAAATTAEADATKLAADADALVVVVKAELAKAVKAGKKSTYDAKQGTEALDAAEKALEEGKAALTAKTFVDAKAKLATVNESLAALQKDLEAAGFTN